MADTTMYDFAGDEGGSVKRTAGRLGGIRRVEQPGRKPADPGTPWPMPNFSTLNTPIPNPQSFSIIG